MAFDGRAFFKEFAVRLPKAPADVVEAMVAKGYLAGVPMRDGDDEVLTVAVTERRSRDEIDGYVAAMKDVLAS
jgi:glycine dehydrogenase subunit 1